MLVCAGAHVRACVRACVRVCVCVCVRAGGLDGEEGGGGGSRLRMRGDAWCGDVHHHWTLRSAWTRPRGACPPTRTVRLKDDRGG